MGYWHSCVSIPRAPCQTHDNFSLSYTLAVGRAPFHASKPDQVLFRVAKGEYAWPNLGKHQNDVPDDLCKLVSQILVDEHLRPSLDTIVSHDFFKVGYLPDVLSESALTSTPKWAAKPLSPADIKRGYTEAWYKQCKASGVGEYALGKHFSVVGDFPSSSIYRECEREAESGKMPIVPMPQSAIYVPFIYKRGKGGLENIKEREVSAISSQSIQSSSSSMFICREYGGCPSPSCIKSQESCKGYFSHGIFTRSRNRCTSDEAHTSLYIDISTVLARARELRDNIITALTSSSEFSSAFCDSRSIIDHLPFVCKWVDYSKKHGIGYVLATGSVGIIANHTDNMPITHTVVEHGSKHFQKNCDGSKPISFAFFMQADDGSLEEVTMTDAVRKQHTTLWAKFARYLCKQIKEQTTGPSSEEGERPTTIVRFYQRLGNVSFNFPDHTKIVLSADGTYASFTVLPLSAIKYINGNGNPTDLPFEFIMARGVVSGTINQLLYGTQPTVNLTNKSTSSTSEIDVLALTEANRLPDKLRFIIEVVGYWISGGGLGCKPVGMKWLMWEGMTLNDAWGSKLDWVTVGRFGGDKQSSEE
ncbi:uncharacterized protein K460DRAFT_271994 [Cucurbitaria berberidis CBS 394.84]|uniref:Protein kinase domain-containing protein n=1 Tax=Cucurbitaria berberidis CBS 394.84 TaxID=1168544 RepID=A0A9P4GT28_9PLEO|nr:uncharacterized protein K460DRAFT_271994 [Cucurbitaria berberidis CBS 394.84]KAF1850812.1 hypothetical protein K460DRAFT_271994 [Cucurbitaria berberidis CBS 394.84]